MQLKPTTQMDPILNRVRGMVTQLLQPRREFLRNRLEEICKKQQVLHPPHEAYIYGKHYFSYLWNDMSSEHCYNSSNEPIRKLDEGLHKVHLEWADELTIFRTDYQKIQQTIQSICTGCTEEEVRNMLPDVVGGFQDIPRTKISLSSYDKPASEVVAVWDERRARLFARVEGIIAYHAGQKIL